MPSSELVTSRGVALPCPFSFLAYQKGGAGGTACRAGALWAAGVSPQLSLYYLLSLLDGEDLQLVREWWPRITPPNEQA